MSRFHIHLHVRDLADSVAFYSRLFGRKPDRLEDDYARWIEDEPAINFALSAGIGEAGVSHVGIQFEDKQALEQLKQRALAPGVEHLDQVDAACCYARSDKSWIQDPDGLPWELFETHGQLDSFGEDRLPKQVEDATESEDACCAPACCSQ